MMPIAWIFCFSFNILNRLHLTEEHQFFSKRTTLNGKYELEKEKLIKKECTLKCIFAY